MPDNADVADTLSAEHLAASLAAARAPIAAGVAGICDDCGEDMPRLVDGRCGFCRDGRTPPPSFFDKEPTKMATPTPTPTSQTISVPASGDVLAAIKRRSEGQDLPLGRAAINLLEEMLARPAEPTPAPVAAAIADAGVDELLTEVARRFADAAQRDDDDNEALGAALARAETAEEQLAKIRAAMGIAG